MEKSAEEYLAKHKILELFENLTSSLVFQRPENPRAFMITYIEKLIDSRTTHMNHPCLFNDSNLKSLFGMLDVTNHGYISLEQYRQALENLGVKNFNQNPVGADSDGISLEVFLRESRTGLLKSYSTFAST